jgi:hypothetical protein
MIQLKMTLKPGYTSMPPDTRMGRPFLLECREALRRSVACSCGGG